MSYTYETQYNSPNYTPAAQVSATWGRPRTIEAIAIHWWGDPNTNPSYKGVINTLCNPARGASAHYVATGTGRMVACLVSPADASWATNQANPYTVSIECDPRCREEDYDVVAELISQIRDAYGDIPLVAHRDFKATACPGNYNLTELDRRARLKDGSGEWGNVKDKVVSNPHKDVSAAYPLAKAKTVIAKLDKTELWDLDTNPNYVSRKTFAKGTEIDVVAAIDFNGSTYYQTQFSYDAKNKWGINSKDVDDKPVVIPPTPVPEPTPVPDVPVTPIETDYDKENNSLLKDILKIVQDILSKISGIFK